jgi:hypothetical protein
MDSDVKCQDCVTNYQPNSLGNQCFQKYDVNCTHYSSVPNGIECDTCADTFMLMESDNKCYSEISGCLTYTKYFGQGKT